MPDIKVRAQKICCGAALVAVAVVMSACSPTNYLRDEYMGKRFLQPGKVRPAADGLDRAERYSSGRNQSRENTVDDTLPVLVEPVPRDQDGNPILR